MLKSFVKAYDERQKRDLENANTIAWLNGMYVLKAINASFGKNQRYDDKPINLGLREDTEKPKKNNEAYAKFYAYSLEWNKKIKQRKESEINGTR